MSDVKPISDEQLKLSLESAEFPDSDDYSEFWIEKFLQTATRLSLAESVINALADYDSIFSGPELIDWEEQTEKRYQRAIEALNAYREACKPNLGEPR